MTSEEIKRTVSMEELVERYGLYPNRAGFIVCPFHKGEIKHITCCAIYKSQKAKEERQIREKKRQQTVQHNIDLIDIYRASISRSQPLGDEWCESYNALQKELLAYEKIHGKGGVAGDETFR